MKANQAFRQNDEAVSPVIGVILMVAITVVLAAVVFVLVSNLGKGTDSKPQVGFTKDEDGANAGGILTVATITNGPVQLNKLVIGGTANTPPCTYNAGAFPTSTSTGNMAAGDQIKCTGTGTITLSESSTGTLLYSSSFV